MGWIRTTTGSAASRAGQRGRIAVAALVAAAVALVLVTHDGDHDAAHGRSGDGEGEHAEISRVIDGDTVELEDGTHVRLIGINTPEIAHFGEPRECFGRRAAEFTAQLLAPGEDVRLVRDVEEHDQYGRLLAYVYRSRDGLFVNAEIVRQGYAYVDTVPPNVAHVDLFRRLAREARERDTGLWGTCPTSGGQPRSLAGAGCLPDYEGECVPPPPPDLDCSDLHGPITVVGDDPHHLDGDHDGRACEPIPDR